MEFDERSAAPRGSPLTQRQRVALELVSQGLCTKEIALLMEISEPGAKKHLDGLRRKYRVANRAELVRRAYEAGDLGATVLFGSERNQSDDFRSVSLHVIDRTAANHGTSDAPMHSTAECDEASKSFPIADRSTLEVQNR